MANNAPVQAFKRPTAGAATGAAAPPKQFEDDARPYIIVDDIGKGSFATVYKGYHQDTRQTVAIKQVKRDNLTTKLFENLQSEIQILKSLSHRHITKLIDIVRAEKHIYLIMEYCAGGDLTNYIKKRGRVEGLEYVPAPGAALQYYPHPRTGGLDEVAVRCFLRQLGRALKFLRHRNLIHRDIKPQNLLLNPASPEELARGHPLGVPILKVADFGFARSLPEAMLAETLCGSPLYMAPEILRYEKYDARADLWSVGAVLYEMSVGRAPFRAQNHIELLRKIESSKGVKFPDEDASDKDHKERGSKEREGGKDRGGSADLPVPEDIKALIRKLLQRNPVERASYEEFFGSRAMVRSKFPRPQQAVGVDASASLGASNGQSQHAWPSGRPPTPEHHRIIPPEVLDMNALIPPSQINFRQHRTIGAAGGVGALDVGVEVHPSNGARAGAGLVIRDASPLSGLTTGNGNGKKKAWAGTVLGPGAGAGARRLDMELESSYIPGESEEDGNLRREYVLVGDKRAVEVFKTVDEISSAQPPPRRPLHDRRAQTFDKDYNAQNLAGPSSATPSPSNPSHFPQPSYATNAAASPLSPITNTTTVMPIPTTSTPTTHSPMTFPPPPAVLAGTPISPIAPPLSSSPSRAATNALNRALSIASKKLFGHGHGHSASTGTSSPGAGPSGTSNGTAGPSGSGNGKHRASPSLDSGAPTPGGYFSNSAQSSPRRMNGGAVPLPGDDADAARGVGTGGGGVGGPGEVAVTERDPMEEELLASLEELAQKTDVLTRWADQMYEYVKAIPQKPLPDPSKFTQREGEPDKHARRRKHADMEAEFNAVTCVAVYMLLMSFSQKGIDKLRNFQEHMSMRFPEGDFVVSEGFGEALNWFREHFIKCNERAELVKTWLPVTYDGPKSYLDQLVYDRALILSRTAARKELLDQMTTPDECEKLYEESLWCLYALQDNLLQSGNPFMDEDRETIATWIKRTKLRLVRCRARMAMNHHDRVNDARADHNLADVMRIPAPWDAKPTPKGSPLHVNTTLS
ncbi:Serine/threonine-protein kinase ATG1 [Psilocybe cubensis]|uniref:non-specific serine/threonine protein kinase n=2 Tax=Psilocybe cubensis TaxID=181762 RepID=A0A8H7XTN8_PSICU|nr:Serine/threonine-protein kinase ATG1 [Psilocybe cubensis]KAH9474396.1 Serine/threonine-protein kinase ATG1 [Psilocybe cubensis]